jgi:agmatinase
MVAGITRSGRRLVGFDLVEIAPGPDGEWDGNVGARILYKLCGHALLGK